MKDLLKFLIFIQFIALLVCGVCGFFIGFDPMATLAVCAITLGSSLTAPVFCKVFDWWMNY